MTSSREAIMARIREALRQPAPRPGTHGAELDPVPVPSSGQPAPPYPFRTWLPVVDLADPAAQRALFARNAQELTAEVCWLETEAALPAALAELARREGWRRLATHPGELTARATREFDRPGGAAAEVACWEIGADYSLEELERCDAGLTECEALVAQTGSVLVSTRRSGGRALSVLPPHHVVVARADQLVPDLSAAYALLEERYAGGTWPSYFGFVTGPSRTGDIERILVLGAHGPKKLTIFCVP